MYKTKVGGTAESGNIFIQCVKLLAWNTKYMNSCTAERGLRRFSLLTTLKTENEFRKDTFPS